MEVISPNSLVGLKPARKARILVVDDERENVELVSRFLTRQGFQIEIAYNGREALERIYRSVPDLILLDITMPVMDGLTLCQQLRMDVTMRSVPIVFLSARNTLEDRLKGLRTGVDDYIGKPFDLEELEARLEGVLQRHRWDLSSHPLTRLPGSPVIEEEVYRRLRIGSMFAFAYIDIDHFKSYNDVYGYEAGDKVIKNLGDLLIGAAQAPRNTEPFAGHIGGDDFIFISTVEAMRTLLPKVANDFDAQKSAFYRSHDWERGYLQTCDRQNQEKQFPLMSLSAAIISTTSRRILHYARLVELATELKRFVKSRPHEGKSLLIWDRRNDFEKGESRS